MKTETKILEKISDKIWRKRGKWHHSVPFSEILLGENSLWAEKLGYHYKKTLVVWLQNGDYLDLQEEWDGSKQYLIDQYSKKPEFFSDFSKLCLSEGEKLIAYGDQLQKTNASELNDSDLIEKYTKLIKLCRAFMLFMFAVHLVDEYLTERFDTLLNEYVEKEGLSRPDFFDYQTALTLPYRKIFVLEEKYNLMKLAIDIKDQELKLDDKNVLNKISDHRENYAWINSILLEHEPYTNEHYIERLKEMIASDVSKEYTRIVDEEEKLRSKQVSCMKKITGYAELKRIAELIKIYGFLRSFRVDALTMSYGRAMNFPYEIMKRLGLSFEQFNHIDSNEIKDLLKQPSKKAHYMEVIERRKAGFVSVLVDDERFEFVNEKADQIAGNIKLPEMKMGTDIKGQVAYPGKVTGKCKVLHSLKDMSKIEKGDILVISMTDPNYIPAMEKAAAFVTDQGGILCHAAIVSREMKKPCIIGTKFATKALKDGDMVEVDADKGIVRIFG